MKKTLFSAVFLLGLLSTPASWAAISSLHDVSWADKTIEYSRFRETYAHLDDAAFKLKLQGSLERPLMFMRSFVNTYYTDAPFISDDRTLVTCLGDAHPENFGFLSVGGENKYVFNDLDDSGVCPIELDILRYFTALSMSENNQILTEKIVETYVAVISGDEPTLLKESMYLSLEDKNTRNLKKYVKAKKFKKSSDYILMKQAEKRQLFTQLTKVLIGRQLNILDAVRVERETGGSGGLRRYWLLVSNTDGLEILELKELSKPGTEYGAWQELDRESSFERLELIKDKIWGDSPEFYHVVTIDSVDYLLRSRTKDAFKLERLTDMEKLHVYQVQASLLAQHHKIHLRMERDQLKDWIVLNTNKMAERYFASYQYFLTND